jgi:hypothetical protein
MSANYLRPGKDNIPCTSRCHIFIGSLGQPSTKGYEGRSNLIQKKTRQT